MKPAEEFYEAFMAYSAGVGSFDATMRGSIRFLDSYLGSHFRDLYCLDDARSAVLERYTKILQERRTDLNARQFIGLMKRVAYNRVITTTYLCSSKEFDFDYACEEYPRGTLPSHKSVYEQILLSELMREVEYRVLDHIRFVTSEGEVCKALLRSIMISRPLVDNWLIRRYKLPQQYIKFLHDYINVSIRRSMYEIREEERLHEGSSEWQDRIGSWNLRY